MPHLVRDGVRIHYQTQGEGVPLLMCNGYGPPLEWVTELYMPNFTDRFQCATFDLRGMGRSDGPEDDAAYDTREIIRDGIAVMDQLGWKTAHIWGASMGALTASGIAIMAPERVRSLTICGPDLGNPNIFQKKYEAIVRDRAIYTNYIIQQKDDPVAAAQGASKYYFAPDLLAKRGDIVDFVAKITRETPAHRIWPSFQKIVDMVASGRLDLPDHAEQDDNVGFPLWKSLPDIKVPTLIMQGYGDQLIHRDSAFAVLDAIPNAELRVFKPFAHSFCGSPEIQRQQSDWIWTQEEKLNSPA